MKKRVITLIILLISLFININYIKAVGVTDNSNNSAHTGKDSAGNSQTTYYVSDGVTGNEMQAIKVAVYRANGKMVEGTSPKYIKLKDGYGSTIYNTCTCKNENDFNSYELTKVPDKTKCYCTKNSSVNIESVDGITGTTKYWFTSPNPWGSDGVSFTKMMNKNDYANVIKALDLVGYKNSDGTYKYQKGDYLIAEPYVTVSCTNFAGVSKSSGKKYISGTINSLIGANISYNGGQQCGEYLDQNGTTVIVPGHTDPITGIQLLPITVPWSIGKEKSLYIWVYSSIAQTFKVSSSCTTGGTGAHGIKPLSTKNYGGCGYNKWSLDDIKVLHEKPQCAYKDNKYYDANGNVTTKANYEKSCFCAAVPNTTPQEYYDKDGKKTTNYNTYRESCFKRTPCSTEIVKVDNKQVTKYYGLDGYEVADLTEFKKSCGCKTTANPNKYYDPDGKLTNETDYINKCKTCAERVTTNPIERINLYKYYVSVNNDPNKNYRNLLDFTLNVSTLSDKATACTNGEPYVINKACLSLSSSNSNKFDQTNLSKYTYSLENGTKTLYCNNTINLSPNMGTTWASKAGMAYIGGGTYRTAVASGTAELTCYLYVPAVTTADKSYDPFGNYSYSKLISSVTLDGKELYLGNVNTGTTVVTTGKYANTDFVKYTKKISFTYYTPAIVIDKNTGQEVSSSSDNTMTRYGLYSKFNEKNSRNVEFSITPSSDSKITLNDTGGKCKYTPSSGIVDGKPKIEFRTIDTKNPFIGEDGKGRITGANWCSTDSTGVPDCSSTNALVQNKIIERNNSYNVKRSQPKYRFVLDSNSINKIRNYNKEVPIDKHEKCSGGVCTNTFFNEIKSSIKIGREYLIN